MYVVACNATVVDPVGTTLCVHSVDLTLEGAAHNLRLFRDPDYAHWIVKLDDRTNTLEEIGARCCSVYHHASPHSTRHPPVH